MARAYIPVASSNVSGVSYNPELKILYVKFKGGTEYAYDNVPEDEYDSLLSAQSVGGYLNDNIKGIYAHKRV